MIATGRSMRKYQREWLRHDLVAGVSVAAVALPTAVAYATIMGFDPVVGLYASILPPVVYALLGTSRHMIVNPDAATCAVVGATLVPLVAGGADTLVPLSAALAIFTGLVCIAGGVCRLGFLADFLAKPILVGFLNGIAIYLWLGQIGKVFGFPMESHGIIPSLLEFFRKLPQTHVPTLVVGLLAIGIMLAAKRYLPRWPAPLLAVAAAVALAYGLDLEDRGVAIVGHLPAGLPRLRWPTFDLTHFKSLLGGALGVALLSYSNAMVVARSFAAKSRDEVDGDREFFALGACQIAAGLCGAFAVSGASSRTAMNYTMGGKTQVAGLVAAATMALVLVFFTGPLGYMPKAALGAILVVAAAGLFDVAELIRLWRFSRAEFAIALVTMLGVVALDVLDGVLLAVGLAVLLVLARASRPPDAVLGKVAGLAGFHNIAHHAGAETMPRLLLYRFGAAWYFFNAPYFKKRVMELIDARPDVECLVVECGPINRVDSTGAEVLNSLARELQDRGVRLCLANVRTEVRNLLNSAGVIDTIGHGAVFPTLESAVAASSELSLDRQAPNTSRDRSK